VSIRPVQEISSARLELTHDQCGRNYIKTSFRQANCPLEYESFPSYDPVDNVFNHTDRKGSFGQPIEVLTRSIKHSTPSPELIGNMSSTGLTRATELLREAKEKYLQATTIFAQSDTASEGSKRAFRRAFELTDEANHLTRLAFRLMHPDRNFHQPAYTLDQDH